MNSLKVVSFVSIMIISIQSFAYSAMSQDSEPIETHHIGEPIELQRVGEPNLTDIRSFGATITMSAGSRNEHRAKLFPKSII